MSYKTKFGQSILDIMLQNKGSITGLTEFYKDLDSLTDTVEDIKEVSINKVSNPVTRFYDSKRLTVSASKFVPEPVIAPNAPVLDPLTVLSDSEITANWDAQVVDFYTVEFDTVNTFDSPNFTTQNTTNTTLTKTGLTQSTEYFAQVKAVNAGGESPYSNIESATTDSIPFTFTVKSDNSGTSNSDQFTFPQRSGTSPNYVIRQQGVTGNEVTVTSDTDPTTITFVGGAGTYTIEIDGDDIQPYFNNGGDRLKMLIVSNWGQCIINDNCFSGCSNISSNAFDLPIVINLLESFDNAVIFNTNATVNNWNTSNVNSIKRLFRFNTIFDQSLNNWDVSNVTDISSAFALSVFNNNITSWNLSNVNNLSSCFLDNTVFNINISNWDVSNVSLFSRTFFGASAFNQNLGSWNLSSATVLTEMLKNAGLSTANYNLTLSGWVNGGWTIPTGLTLGADGLVADITSGGVNGITARNTLINTYGWTIIDATP